MSSKPTSDKRRRLWKSGVLPQVALWGKGILCHKSTYETNYTTNVWQYWRLSAEISLFTISCGFKEIENLKTQEIVIPYCQMLKFEGHNANYKFPLNAKMNLIVYVDESECSSCYIGNIRIWEPLLDSLRNEFPYVKVSIILVEPLKQKKLFWEKLKYTKFQYPLYIDTCNVFAKRNPQIPPSRLYHVFLVNQRNKVVLVGNPIRNDKIRNLLFLYMRGGKKTWQAVK